MKRRFFFLSIILACLSLLAEKSEAAGLSDKADISVLTCGPSDLIYAIYGHTAIRVKDPVRHLDVVFNYGVFSFNAPHFIYRFAKGQTDYMLVPERFSDFYEDYKLHGRSIYAQVLNLNQEEKQKIWDFLVNKARPENREYRYNFFFDNCATRVRDVVQNLVEGTVFFDSAGVEQTFREHVTAYQKVLPWTNFGIQLVLGSPSDKVATAYQEMFLPEFLMKHLAGSQVKNSEGIHPLVKKTSVIYDAGTGKSSGFNLLSPVVVFSVLLVFVLVISIVQLIRKRINYLIDYVLLSFTGLIGFGLLWFVLYSEHPAMHPNYNILWAVPFNLIFSLAWIKKKWRPVLRWYWPGLAVWTGLFFILSLWLPQSFPLPFYLIAVMVFCRAVVNSLVALNSRKLS